MFCSILRKTSSPSKLFYSVSRGVKIEARLKELGLELPSRPWPRGNYVGYLEVGNIAYVSGHLPIPPGGELIVGRLGQNLTSDEGYLAAKYVGLNILATLKHNLGDLDRVKKVIKVVGFVNCIDTFTQQPAVINGCSDLMVEVFGEKGKHARSAVGTNVLPLGIPVEIEAIIEIDNVTTYISGLISNHFSYHYDLLFPPKYPMISKLFSLDTCSLHTGMYVFVRFHFLEHLHLYFRVNHNYINVEHSLYSPHDRALDSARPSWNMRKNQNLLAIAEVSTGSNVLCDSNSVNNNLPPPPPSLHKHSDPMPKTANPKEFAISDHSTPKPA
eukprot:gene6664-13493_t